MEQKDIGKLRAENAEKAREMLRLYSEFARQKDERSFRPLIRKMEEMYLPMVAALLRSKGCDTRENIRTALDFAGAAVWRLPNNEKEEELNLAAYIRTIYKRQAQDIIREQYTKMAPFEESIDDPIGEGGDTKKDVIPGEEPTDWPEKKERARAYFCVFTLFCQALMNSEKAPKENLALFYANVLPHFLNVYATDTIADTKKISAVWAVNRMRGKTVGCLSEDSERVARRKIAGPLSWGPEHLRRLEEPDPELTDDRPVRMLIYTDVYSQNEVSRWSDHLHREIRKRTIRMVSERADVAAAVRDYLGELSVGIQI